MTDYIQTKEVGTTGCIRFVSYALGDLSPAHMAALFELRAPPSMY